MIARKGCAEGRILAMIAQGPSVREVEFASALGHPSIDFMMLGHPYMPIWPTKYWGIVDDDVYRESRDLWMRYDGIPITTSNVDASHRNLVSFRPAYGPGFNLDLAHGIKIGRSVVHAMMQVAEWMGFRKIYVFGCDMIDVEGRLYHTPRPSVDKAARIARFSLETRSYEKAARILGKRAKSFVFASGYNPWPFVSKFTPMDHRNAVPKMMQDAEERGQWA